MSNDFNPTKGFLQQSRDETALRKLIIGYIAGLLRSKDVPVSVKAYIVVVFSQFVLISSEIVLLIIHAICATIQIAPSISFTPYLAFFGLLCCGIVGPGTPLIMRMASVENAARLQAQFREIIQKKELGNRGDKLGPKV